MTRKWQQTRIAILVAVVFVATLAQGPLAHAGILGQLRDSISSLWAKKTSIHSQAQSARVRAGSLQQRAAALHDQLERLLRAL